jgi:muramoyltetrapeptide carboxypeptidase
MRKTILKKGDTIGLIAPAGVITEQKLINSIQNIERLGLKPFFYDSIKDRLGYLAGSDQRRLDELHKMYENNDIKAILCVRGGYGSLRLLDMIDYSLIKRNPKPLIGYSDITALHSAIYKHSEQIGFHGILGAEAFSDYTVMNFKKIFFESSDIIKVKIFGSHKNFAFSIKKGKVEGRLIGGNLSVMMSLLGTNFINNLSESILFIEEVNEAPYKIDRMLTQLILSGKMDGVRGVVFCQFKSSEPRDFGYVPGGRLSIKEKI